MKKQKAELDKLRKDIIEQEQVKAKLQSQTDILKNHYMELFNKKEEFKEEVIEVKRKNVKIERKIVDAKY